MQQNNNSQETPALPRERIVIAICAILGLFVGGCVMWTLPSFGNVDNFIVGALCGVGGLLLGVRVGEEVLGRLRKKSQSSARDKGQRRCPEEVPRPTGLATT